MSELDGWTPTSTWEDHEEQVEQDKLRFRDLCLIRVGHMLAESRVAGAKEEYDVAAAELEAAIQKAHDARNVLERATTYLEKTTIAVGNTAFELEDLLQ